MPDAQEQADSFAQPKEETIAMPAIYSMPEEIAKLFVDSSAQIERIRHNWAGEVLLTKYDDKGNIFPYYAEIGERKMNDKGIRHFISLLDCYINPNTATTTLDDEEIYKITQMAVKVINGVLRAKANEFEIDRNYKKEILNTLGDMIFIELKKAKDGATLKAMTQSYQVRELRGFDQKKTGVTDVLLSPFKRSDKIA